MLIRAGKPAWVFQEGADWHEVTPIIEDYSPSKDLPFPLTDNRLYESHCFLITDLYERWRRLTDPLDQRQP